MYRLVIAVMVSVTLAPIAQAQSADDPYTIMKPEPGRKPQPPLEPWLPPKYQSPRGTKQHVDTYAPAPPRAPAVPPPVYVPETGRLLPNLPSLPGADSGPGGAEHRQDRAVRCAHQAGLYGEVAGNRAAYINSCINQ
jgi:hypothetical protein